jgi:secreted trypsin-like serine protease
MQNSIIRFFLILFLLAFPYYVANETINGRIFDGTEAPINGYPWMVSVRLNFLNYIKRDCGGVIMSDIFLLTAASCFQDMILFTQYFTIKAGIHKIESMNETTEQIRSISHVIPHPNYTNKYFLNDLVLVRVSPPFNLNRSSVFPIALSNLTSVENINLIALGWGVLNQASPTVISASLQQVTVQENVFCTHNKSTSSSTQLCASGK